MSLRRLCGTANIAMHFEESDLVIAPFELDIIKENGKLDHARSRISREAGVLIDEKGEQREPVSIYSDNTKVARLFIPDDGLELATQDAYLKLFDELQILQFIELDKTFTGNWTLGDIIDELMEEVLEHDEFGILTDWQPSNVDIEDDRRTVAGQMPQGFEGGIIDKFGDLAEYLTSEARNRLNFLEDDADFSFEGENALHAVNKISKEFKIDIFTKDDGIVYVGSQEDDVDFYTASFPRETYNLINYSVPQNNKKIKAVLVKGKRVRRSSDPFEPSSPADWFIHRQMDNIYPYGIATRNDIDSGDLILVEANTNDIDALRQIAEQELKNRVRQENSGSAEIDLLSSDIDNVVNSGEDDLRQGSINDVMVVPEHGNLCQNINPGAFMLNRIHHQINRRRGWVVNVDIINILMDEISTAYFAYDTQHDEVFERINTHDIDLSGLDKTDTPLRKV